MSLEMRNIHKAFGKNEVLLGVDFHLTDGEIHGLIGENGAGKSTLMNILGGVLAQDAGEMFIDGAPVRFASPRDSLDAGVAFIHQELNLVPDLAVYENMYLGREVRARSGLLDRRAMMAGAQEVLARMDVPLPVDSPTHSLNAAYKQVVEIARALLMNARIIIMDEPTTSLTDAEIERVFAMMRTLSAQGVAFVFISHKLREVLAICSCYTVLRDGVVVASGNVRDTDERTLAMHMVGHAVRDHKLARGTKAGETLLDARGLSGEGFADVSFALHAGEITGFTGLLGDGRSELFRAIFGDLPYQGELRMRGKPYLAGNTVRATRAGIGYVPRNRKENGIVQDLSIRHNMALATLGRRLKGLARLIDEREEKRVCEGWREQLHIKMDDLEGSILSLSGGNQQKAVLAKWLCAEPRVMIFDNPTQGVDVGAKEEIYDVILTLAARGVAVAVLSSEAAEIIRLCDRALVMYHGSIRGELSGDDMTERNIMLLATGADR